MMQACNSCGKCCSKYSDGGLSATQQEIEMWGLFRPDIEEFVKDGKIWMHPKTGEQLSVCPWLRETPTQNQLTKTPTQNQLTKTPTQNRYTCDIYLDRPDDCKYYPVTIQQMIDDECEMLEPADLKDLRGAQIKLDVIMQDSRPPLESK